MNIARKTTGWLCFLSFLATLFWAGYWAYSVIAPFYRGADVYNRASPDWVSPEQSALFAQTPSSEVLEDYAQREGGWRQLRLDWWDHLERWPVRRVQDMVSELPPNPTVAMVLLDREGEAVASYPDIAVERLSPLQLSMQPHEDQQSVPLPPSWKTALEQARAYRRDPTAVEVLRVRKDEQHTAGYLVTISAGSDSVVLMPASAAYSADASVGAMRLSLIAFVTYLLTLPIWAALDAGWRGMRRLPWALLVIVTGWIGLLAYLIARLPPQRPCLNCGSPVFAKYKRCPVCGVSLAARCPICRTVMKAGWQYCPRCSGEELRAPVIETAVLVTEDQPAIHGAPVLPAKGVSMIVRVVAASSGAPIPAAVVVVRDKPHLQGLTKHDGTFELWRLHPGSYTLSASKQGYESGQVQTSVTEESRGSVEIALQAKPGSISGRILDRASLAPIAQAHIELDSTRIERSSRSEGNGAYALDDIPPGPYTVSAEVAGFAAQTKLVEVPPGQPAPLDFALERQAELPARGEGGHE